MSVRIMCFATQGPGHRDEARIVALLADFETTTYAFDRSDRLCAAFLLLRYMRRERPDVVVMEGTGVGGGVPLLLAGLTWGQRYVVSSGDAVAPFIAGRSRLLGPFAWLYERLLYRRAAGFIGWTPYLSGRAIALGARRAMTAPGWAPSGAAQPTTREAVRRRLGIPSEALVFGLVGSLEWASRVGYCYGLELVEAIRKTRRSDVRALIVGDGTGYDHLAARAGEDLGERVLLTGRVDPEEVPEMLAAMDVASLPQSVDAVGASRYTTKLPEYLVAGLPVVTGQIPLAYDLDDGWLWRLPGDAPWEGRYTSAFAELITELTPAEIERRRAHIPEHAGPFDATAQRHRVASFIADLLND